MRADLPQLLPLICPACRRLTERGRELFTLSLVHVIRCAPASAEQLATSTANTAAVEVEEGILACDNPACGRRYPIVGGVPIILPPQEAVGGGAASLGSLVSGQLAALAALPPELAMLSALDGPDDAPLPRLLEHLSIYLDAHWGDRATPPPAGPGGQTAGWGSRELMTTLAARAQEPVACAVELGCSVGRGLVELSHGAQLVVGVDLHLGALLSACRLLRGDALRYARRILGRHYALAQITAGPPLASRVALICGDALDPPLLPQGFARVVACNLIDSVRSPAGLLSVVDGLCAPGGEILLASPYSWQSGVVDEGARLGGADPAADLRAILLSGGRGLVAGLEAPYTLEDDRDLRWELRRDARSAHAYSVHYLRARKAALP